MAKAEMKLRWVTGLLLGICIGLWVVPLAYAIFTSWGEGWASWYVPMSLVLIGLALVTFWYRTRTLNLFFMALLMVMGLVPLTLRDESSILILWPMWFGLFAGTLLGDRYLVAWRHLKEIPYQEGSHFQASLLRYFIISLTLIGGAFLIALISLSLTPFFDLSFTSILWLIVASFLTLATATLLLRTDIPSP